MTLTVTTRNGDGGPIPGRSVAYAIGARTECRRGEAPAVDGTAAIMWTGTNLGTDRFTAFMDLNGNGTARSQSPSGRRW